MPISIQTGETGFSPNVFAYSVVTERDMQPVTTAISVTKSTYSTVDYAVWDTGSKFLQGGTISEDHNTFDLNVNAKQDMWIRITVKKR